MVPDPCEELKAQKMVMVMVTVTNVLLFAVNIALVVAIVKLGGCNG